MRLKLINARIVIIQIYYLEKICSFYSLDKFIVVAGLFIFILSFELMIHKLLIVRACTGWEKKILQLPL